MKKIISIIISIVAIISISTTHINAKSTMKYYGFYGSVCTVFKKSGNKLTVKTLKKYPIEYYKKNRLFTSKKVGSSKTFKLSKKMKYYSAYVDEHMRLYNPGTVEKESFKKIKKYIKASHNDEGESYLVVAVKNGVATKIVCCFS